MKSCKYMLALLLLAVLTAGCTAAPVETAPTGQTITEPVTVPVTEPEPLPDPEGLFDGSGGIYHQAAGHAYGAPADVDLNYIFYNGVGYPGSWDAIGEAERALLVDAGFWQEMDIQIMPAGLLEEKLRTVFGVGLADVQIPAEWAYSPDTDTYYANHNDAYSCAVTVTGREELSDGTVLLHLVVDAVQDGDEWYWEMPMDMTLRPASGGWQIVSNVFARAVPAETVKDLAYYQDLMRWDRGDAYFRAAGSVFNTTEDLDLYYFFYNGVGIPARWDMLCQEDRDLLLAAGFREELDLQMLPRDVLEAQLEQYFGLGLEAFRIPAEWVWEPGAEVWYTNHSDAWAPQVTVTDFEAFEDGVVRLYLTVDAVMDHTGELVWDAAMVMTLRPAPDGRWQIVSNAFAQDVI